MPLDKPLARLESTVRDMLKVGLPSVLILGAAAVIDDVLGLDRLSIGIGMIPRGEVGLIFANIGLGLRLAGQPIVDDGILSAVVIMVIVTTMATPPLLKWSLARGRRSDIEI